MDNVQDQINSYFDGANPGCSILLVDDNKAFLEILVEFLEEDERFQVQGAYWSARKALEHLHTQIPELIITDLIMTDMGGLDFTRLVTEQFPGIPVIILTLMDTPNYRQAALDAGAARFVAKSHLDSELPEAICSLFNYLLPPKTAR